jgi:hypothetical protein
MPDTLAILTTIIKYVVLSFIRIEYCSNRTIPPTCCKVNKISITAPCLPLIKNLSSI